MGRRRGGMGAVLGLALLVTVGTGWAADGPLHLTRQSLNVWPLGMLTPPGRTPLLFFNSLEGSIDDIDSSVWGVWVSDGTSAGTRRLQAVPSVYAGEGVTFSDNFFFTASDGLSGTNLWRSDGTESGTRPVFDGATAPFRAAGSPVLFRGRLFLVADDGVTGGELWSTDGTEEGTALVRDIRPGPDTSWLGPFTIAGDLLFFAADDGVHGTELWRSDGTEAGTFLVEDLWPGSHSSCCDFVTEFQGRLLFGPTEPVYGHEPWVSDGTEAGTHVLKDINPGASNSFVMDPIRSGPYVFFGARDAAHGAEIWRTDGTTEGTVLLKDFVPGPESSFIQVLGASPVIGDLGDRVLFAIHDPSQPLFDLWTSDGTESGTTKIGPIMPAEPARLGSFDGVVLFIGGDEVHGWELWRSDGTAAGTTMVQDLTPGDFSSFPTNVFRLASRLLVRATPDYGVQQFFGGRAALVLGRPAQAVHDLIAELEGSGASRGIRTSLSRTLQNAAAAIDADRTVQATVLLENFTRRVDQESGRSLDPAAAAGLVEFATDILQALEPSSDSQPPAGALPKGLRQRLEP